MLDGRTGLTPTPAKAVWLSCDSDPAPPLPGVRTVPNSGMPLRRPNAGKTHSLRGKLNSPSPRTAAGCRTGNRSRFVRENFVSQGMIADVAFHHMDKTNPPCAHHADHEGYRTCWVQRKVRDWNDRTHAETWRASWADHANRALANAGYQEEIDHRSYERQGLRKRLVFTSESLPVRWNTRGIETERGEQIV